MGDRELVTTNLAERGSQPPARGGRHGKALAGLGVLALCAVIVAIVVGTIGIRIAPGRAAGVSPTPTPNAVAPLSSSQGPSPSAFRPVPSPSASVTARQSATGGMVIQNAQAVPVNGIGNPVVVTATITNRTGRDDKFLGGSSPTATTAGLYDPCGCLVPGPTDPITGIANIMPSPWWAIGTDETIQMDINRYGVLVLSGLSHPLTPGQTIEVTFKFANAAPVTVEVQVVAALASN
jgi:copper(I)-binding protein